MKFHPHQRLGDIVLSNHQFLPVLHRLGIHLGFGDAMVDEVCTKHGVDTSFFLEIISAFHDRDYRPYSSIERFPIPQTIAYLRNAHADYLQHKVPKVDALIRALVKSSANDENRLAVLEQFFKEYRSELNRHIKREEDRVFPYALKIYEAYMTGQADGELIANIENYPISAYAHEHDNVEEKLVDLKSILVKYISLPEQYGLINSILTELCELEADLNDHARLEDLILVPVIIEMEKAILRQSSSSKKS